MQWRSDKDDLLTAATEHLVSVLTPAAVIVFGSHATGKQGPRSDYDLAFLTPSIAADWEVVRALQADLEAIVRAPVDLVLLDSASPILSMQILREGRLLACRSEQGLENFTVRTLTAYADLKIARAPIEARLLEPHSQ